MADVAGAYQIGSLCANTYRVVCTYVGYATDTVTLTLRRNEIVNFRLHSDSTSMNEVVVEGERDQRALATQSTVEIKGEELLRTRGTTLAESLTGVTGVYALQTGPTIFKPVIHGLHSNRVLILNNGVRLEGQQWGSEHAPEIDPFIANRLTVVKGAASIRYGSDAIGGVVSADPAPMPSTRGFGGEVNLVGASNNRMGVVSGILQQAFDKKLAGLSWRLQGTIRRAGNTRAPDYYIENTGFREVNYSAAISWKRPRYGVDVYASRFETKLGIFTGSYANSISDLRVKIQQDKPSTPSYFSYAISRPYQQVLHALIKTDAWYRFKNAARLDVVFARQQNDRYEYDFTPLNGSTNPELYLKLVTHTLDVIYSFHSGSKWSSSAGFNGMTQGNVRQYEMLIPNFRNYGGGIFYLAKRTGEKLTLEAGVRYDYRWLRAYLLDNNTAQKITPTFDWQNATGTIGAEYFFRENLSLNAAIGTAWRAPTVSELLSNGVHQSAGSYEKGNQNLTLERAYNFSASLHYSGERVHGEIGVYNNVIDGYIFLKPQGAFIHTVRGSKPVFVYTQVDARFRGIDFSVTWDITKSFSFTAKESLLYAWNNTLHDYLQLVPANRFQNSLRYQFPDGALKQLYASIGGTYTAKQTRVPDNSDFLAPPPGYFLLYADAGFGIPIGKHLANVTLSAGNILNSSYRDYMDRFRYYTDEPGRNFTLRLSMPFGVPSF